MKILVALFVTGCLSQPPFTGTGSGSGSGSGSGTTFVTAGFSHACAISDGQVRCWGAGDQNQNALGHDTGSPALIPEQKGTWTEVAAGDDHTCGIEADAVFCWGDNQKGQLGVGDASSNQPPSPPELGQNFTAIHVFAGGQASCAIDDSLELHCWGTVDGVLTMPTVFAPTGAPTMWRAVALTSDHACALAANGQVWCWGDGSHHQFGDVAAHVTMANAVQKSGTFSSIAARTGSTCGTTTDHTLVCWGAGDDDLFLTAGPSAEVTVDANLHWTSVALGSQHACGIADENALYCWGDDPLGAEGQGLDTRVTSFATPTATATMVAAGAGFTCAIDSGSVYCWGANVYGELGNGEIATTLLPTLVATGASKIAVGRDHTCALLASGISCWGRNDGLVPGNNDTFLPTPTPETMASFPTLVDQLVAGDRHTCFLTINGSYMCWGNNSEKQLAPMGGGTTFISAGGDTTCVENDSSSIKCWGVEPGGSRSAPVTGSVYAGPWNNSFAVNDQLAIGLQSDRRTISEFGIDPEASGPTAPTTMPLYSPYKDTANATMQFAVGYQFGCALVGAGGHFSVICWGANDVSQCAAAPSAFSEASTFAPPNETTWLPITANPQIAASDAHACAISNAGNLFCWGSNASLALGSTIDVMTTTPVAMPIPNVTQVATGPLDTCAIDADQNLYCWGYNEYGEVGTGARFYGEPVLTKYP